LIVTVTECFPDVNAGPIRADQAASRCCSPLCLVVVGAERELGRPKRRVKRRAGQALGATAAGGRSVVATAARSQLHVSRDVSDGDGKWVAVGRLADASTCIAPAPAPPSFSSWAICQLLLAPSNISTTDDCATCVPVQAEAAANPLIVVKPLPNTHARSCQLAPLAVTVVALRAAYVGGRAALNAAAAVHRHPTGLDLLACHQRFGQRGKLEAQLRRVAV
jgi:hypothetical protein